MAHSVSLNARVARTIKRLRISKKLSQEELADLAGLDRTYISGIERQRRNITLSSLERIALVLCPDLATFLVELVKDNK